MSEGQTGWRKWAYMGAAKGLAISDWAGTRANSVGAKFGVERFWPTSGDYIQELEKCERILRTFCVEGLPVEEEVSTDPAHPATAPKKKRKVYRKIPPKVIQEAKGIVIFTAMRSGFAPFAGAGGGGIVMARMKNGSWSAPSFVSPNNLSAGLMLGLDVYNAVLILRTEQAVTGFRTHHVTMGAELAVAAGPLGYGISGETGLKSPKVAPIFSYVLSKGFYAGVEVVGQVFVDRFDENERVYYWPGIKAGDIFDGKVRRPHESDKLYKALHDAELGIAQGASLEWNTDEVYSLDLEAGEVLKLPPTPEQLSVFESAGIQDEEDVQREREEKKYVKSLPPPPRHPHARNAGARKSDSSLLEGRKGMRSPALGLSASQCNSPDLDGAHWDEAEGNASRSSWGTPARSRLASPLGSPSIPFYDADAEEASEVQDKSKQQHDTHHSPREEPAVIPLPKIEETGLSTSQEDAEGKTAEHAQVQPQSEKLEIPQPPTLVHQDSNTSTSSFYSEASDSTVPPTYADAAPGSVGLEPRLEKTSSGT